MSYKKLSELDYLSKEELSNAFKYIFDEYKNLVCYVIMQVIDIPYLVEEIMNDTFLVLFQHWNEIKDKNKIKAYLTTTAKRLAYKQAKSYNEDNKNLDYSQEIEYVKTENYYMYENKLSNFTEKFKDYLTKEDLDLLIKSIYFEYKAKEIAREQGVSVFTIATRIRRLKVKLRKFYEKEK